MSTQTHAYTLKSAPTFGSVSVDDLGKAKAFYKDVLGLEVKECGGMGLDVALANGASEFLYAKKDHKPGSFTVLNFEVDDIDEAVAGLKAAGVKFESYGGDIKTDEKGVFRGSKKGDGGPDIAWLKDPAGNILSVLHENKP